MNNELLSTFGAMDYGLATHSSLLLFLLAIASYACYHRVWRRWFHKNKTTLSPLTLIHLAHGAYASLAHPLPLLGWKRLRRHVQCQNQTATVSSQQGAGADELEDLKVHPSASLSEPGIDVFVHSNDKVVVLAVRGTDPSFVGDLTQDLHLFGERVAAFVEGSSDRHHLPAYTGKLLQVMADCERDFSDHSFYLTGHSLGAACCEAAWAADLALKFALSQQQQRTLELSDKATSVTSNRKDSVVWRCVTWESPGFAVNTGLQGILNQHRDLVTTHVVHYLGAPNLINCLHPHISPNRRYRVFLEHDNRLTCGYILGCLWRDVVVILNWMSLVRAGLGLGIVFHRQAAEAARQAAVETAAAVSPKSPGFSWNPEGFWCFVNGHIRQLWTSPVVICSNAGINFQATANVLSKYQEAVGNVQQALIGWFPVVGDTSLAASTITSNTLLQGERSLEHLLRQHSLMNHINSFDVQSGYPLRWGHMESWPSLAEMTSNTLWEGLRAALVPPSGPEHVDPAMALERRIQRLQSYQEKRQCTADVQVLKDTYNYLGDGFFDELGIPTNSKVTRSHARIPVDTVEERCRAEYRKLGKLLPTPLYIVG